VRGRDVAADARAAGTADARTSLVAYIAAVAAGVEVRKTGTATAYA